MSDTMIFALFGVLNIKLTLIHIRNERPGIASISAFTAGWVFAFAAFTAMKP